ncbi:hypothetical protein BD779DRAFT_1680483 [Infundibulicybe gibba]|nr:hypothetical protein BD779DRAFT_1680483 [Infundibulicybe gibba]
MSESLEWLSLPKYVDMAEMFAELDQKLFMRFILTGQHLLNSQVAVDPSHNLVNEQHPISLLRDYNTVIGFTKDIIVQGPFTILSTPQTHNFLSTNIHLVCPLSMSTTAAGRPVNQIPNFMLGSWGQLHQIFIFFPSLATEDRQDPQLAAEEMAIFRLCCLYSAINKLGGGPNFQLTEMLGTVSRPEHELRGNKVMPARSAMHLCHQIRQNAMVAGVTWASDIFFAHIIHGAKRAIHHMKDPHLAKEALAAHLSDVGLPKNVAEIGEWWIDVGLEIASAEGMCLQWSTSSHSYMAQAVLQVNERDANHITSIGSPEYTRDLASHLPSVSGCRIEPGPRYGGCYEAKYFQMCTTDGTLAYAPKGKCYGAALTIADAMGLTQPPEFISGLCDVYKLNASNGDTSNARVEVRVPLEHALGALQTLDPAMVSACLMGFTPRDWWMFKAYRVMGIKKALQALAESSPRIRVTPGALLLTAACVWLINSIHSQPDDGPASKELMQAVLPLTSATHNRGLFMYPYLDTEGHNGGEVFPYTPFGVIFLRGIQHPLEVPRIQCGDYFLSTQAFRSLFGRSLEDVRHSYTGDPLSNMDEDEWGEAGEFFDSELTQMWNQFLVDVVLDIKCVPYLRTSMEGRVAISEDTFRGANLSKIWVACQYRIGGPIEWRTSSNNLFPMPESKTNREYMRYPYFQEWRRISAAVSPMAARNLQEQLLRRVSAFSWIPQAGQDGMWSTMVDVGGFTRLPLDSAGPAPRILFKWSEPCWDDETTFE